MKRSIKVFLLTLAILAGIGGVIFLAVTFPEVTEIVVRTMFAVGMTAAVAVAVWNIVDYIIPEEGKGL